MHSCSTNIVSLRGFLSFITGDTVILSSRTLQAQTVGIAETLRLQLCVFMWYFLTLTQSLKGLTPIRLFGRSRLTCTLVLQLPFIYSTCFPLNPLVAVMAVTNLSHRNQLIVEADAGKSARLNNQLTTCY